MTLESDAYDRYCGEFERPVLQFPAGSVVKTKPSREALENSLESWAAVTVMNAQIVHREPTAINVRGLKSSVATLERIIAELEAL